MSKTHLLIRSSDQTLISRRVTQAQTLKDRMVGLLNRTSLDQDEALLLRPCSCVHTVMMKFPIDVVFLNRKKNVIAIYHNLRPWRLSLWHPLAVTCIELPSGQLQRLGIHKGDRLDVVS